MTLDYANEYPDVLSRQPVRRQPSGRAHRLGAVSTEQDGKSNFVLGRVSLADPVQNRQGDEAVVCLCKDLPV